MTMMSKPAVELRQGGRALYITSLTVSELAAPGFCSVDELDTGDDSGFQRVLEEPRAKRLAADMVKARAAARAFLPTTVLLATGRALDYDPARRVVSFDPDAAKFNVVDGQHRINGMRRAVAQDESLANFPVAAVIAAGLDDKDQTYHFYLVNTKQKSVDKSVEQMLMARLRNMDDLGERGVFIPDRILREVRRKDGVRDALHIVTRLNSDPRSPWFQRVRMANEPSGPRTTIKQNAFVNSVKKYLLVAGYELNSSKRHEETRHAMLRDYWRAVEDVFVEGDARESVAFRHSGTLFFHRVSMPMFVWLAALGNYQAEKAGECFRKAFARLPKDAAELATPGWWRRGSASALNSTAMDKCAEIMSKAVYKACQDELGGGRV